MSDARLISKLTQAGYSSEQIETMNREALMIMWAEAIVAGKEANAAAAHSKVGYDPELEKQRLAWEIKRFDEEEEYHRAKDAERKKRDEEEIEIRKKEIALKEAKIKKVEADNELRLDYVKMHSSN